MVIKIDQGGKGKEKNLQRWCTITGDGDQDDQKICACKIMVVKMIKIFAHARSW